LPSVFPVLAEDLYIPFVVVEFFFSPPPAAPVPKKAASFEPAQRIICFLLGDLLPAKCTFSFFPCEYFSDFPLSMPENNVCDSA